MLRATSSLSDRTFRNGFELSCVIGGSSPEHENGVRNLFSLCVDVCEESDEIVSMEKVPGTCFELILLLLQEPIGMVRRASPARRAGLARLAGKVGCAGFEVLGWEF